MYVIPMSKTQLNYHPSSIGLRSDQYNKFPTTVSDLIDRIAATYQQLRNSSEYWVGTDVIDYRT